MTLLALWVASASPAFAKGKVWFTYPQPPKVKPADPLRANPGYQVPEYPERYTWKVTDKLNGKVVYPNGLPAYNLKDGRVGAPVAHLPVGTEVKLDQFMRLGRTLYYAVPFDGQTVWISGAYLQAAAYTPPVQ